MKTNYFNLTSGFMPLNNDISFDLFTFNGGEPHIKLHNSISKNEKWVISHRINSFNDLGILMVAVDALRRYVNPSELSLFIPYFPGARQDRLMVKGEPLTVKVYADIVNMLKFDKVTIFDPHSDVTSALINNCEVINNHVFVEAAIHLFDSDGLEIISPDAGANKKIDSLCKFLRIDSFIRADKSRDIKTGKITGFEVYANDLEQKTCIIVDDICDGGGTFIGLAKELQKHNVGDLYLIVSHGIFSNGVTELNKYFKQIYTTDSINNLENVTKIKLSEI